MTKERETKSVETPIYKHRLVVYKWLTKSERLNINDAATERAEGVIGEDKKQVIVKHLGNEKGIKERLLLSAVKSVDDRTGDAIRTYVMDELPEWEADEILEEVDKVISENDKRKKKE